MTKVLCIYHGNCTDGFAAAWAVRSAFVNDDIEFHAGFYGNEPPDPNGRDVVLVDFSYKRASLLSLAARSNTVLVLDHHKTAADDLAGFPAAVEIPGEKIAAVFDMARSGAGLAWDFFHPGRARPWLIDLIETRDLWREEDYRWQKARLSHAYINSFPFEFGEWDEHMRISRSEEGQEKIIAEGAAILRQHDKLISDLLPQVTREMTIGGQRAPVANLSPNMASDGGNLMLRKNPSAPFAASYFDGASYRYFSLRSSNERADVGAIAASYGGGGHRNASGFRMPLGWEGDELRSPS